MTRLLTLELVHCLLSRTSMYIWEWVIDERLYYRLWSRIWGVEISKTKWFRTALGLVSHPKQHNNNKKKKEQKGLKTTFFLSKTRLRRGGFTATQPREPPERKREREDLRPAYFIFRRVVRDAFLRYENHIFISDMS